MMDLYLRAPDQVTMDSALFAAGLLIDSGDSGLSPAAGICLDRIGCIDRIVDYDQGEPIFEHSLNITPTSGYPK